MPPVICPLSIVPVRAEPSDRAEMVTQWLFGETAEVLEKQGSWSRLRFDHDGYEGWVDNKQIEPLDQAVETNVRLVDETEVDLGGRRVRLPYGAVLPSFRRSRPRDLIAWRDGEVEVNALVNLGLSEHEEGELAMLHAQPFLGAPYLWGGRTPWGVDCSGFTQMVFLLMGTALPRDAHLQAEEGIAVDSLDEAGTGDLAFFANEKGHIVHVGIIIQGTLWQFGEQERHEDESFRIMHASGCVRIDRLDEEGILNEEEGRHTHRLRVIRRV